MFGHFKKYASFLTDQKTQMVGNDQWPATICNAENLFPIQRIGKKTHQGGREIIFFVKNYDFVIS